MELKEIGASFYTPLFIKPTCSTVEDVVQVQDEDEDELDINDVEDDDLIIDEIIQKQPFKKVDYIELGSSEDEAIEPIPIPTTSSSIDALQQRNNTAFLQVTFLN